MHEHQLSHFLDEMYMNMKRDKLEDKMVVRQVVVQAESKKGKDCMVNCLVV